MPISKGAIANKASMKKNGITNINILLPEETKMVFKGIVSSEGQDMTKVILNFIRKYISKNSRS